MKKSDLRREWRQSHRVASRRELGRRPTRVYQRVRDSLNTADESLAQLASETCIDGQLHDVHEAPEDTWVCVVCGTEYDSEPDFEYTQT